MLAMSDFILEQASHGFLRQHKWEVAVLPFGATEPHNYHMPYGTDTFQVEEIGRRACEAAYKKGAKVLLLPAMPFGVNTNHLQVKVALALSVTPTTLLKVLTDLVDALERQGIRKRRGLLIAFFGDGAKGFVRVDVLHQIGLIKRAVEVPQDVVINAQGVGNRPRAVDFEQTRERLLRGHKVRIHERGKLRGVGPVAPEGHAGGRCRIYMISQGEERPPSAEEWRKTVSLRASLRKLTACATAGRGGPMGDRGTTSKRLANFCDLTNAPAALWIDSPERMTIQ